MINKDIREEFTHWLVIVLLIIWFFFLVDISHRQGTHKKALESGKVFRAPDHNEGYFHSVIIDEAMRD